MPQIASVSSLGHLFTTVIIEYWFFSVGLCVWLSHVEPLTWQPRVSFLGHLSPFGEWVASPLITNGLTTTTNGWQCLCMFVLCVRTPRPFIVKLFLSMTGASPWSTPIVVATTGYSPRWEDVTSRKWPSDPDSPCSQKHNQWSVRTWPLKGDVFWDTMTLGRTLMQVCHTYDMNIYENQSCSFWCVCNMEVFLSMRTHKSHAYIILHLSAAAEAVTEHSVCNEWKTWCCSLCGLVAEDHFEIR